MTRAVLVWTMTFLLGLAVWGCSGGGNDGSRVPDGSGGNPDVQYPETPDDLPAAGNPDGNWPVPDAAMEEDTGNPDEVIGDGTPESCTSDAVVAAVARGGIITFDCGPDPVTITMHETAKVFNDTGPKIVIDGGGLVTLSGGGERRILYMNTCDPDQVWTTPHCDDQDHPRLTVQNLTFIDAKYMGGEENDVSGGGAIWIRGGRFKVVNCRFFNNECAHTGPDLGGAAIRVFDQYNDLPVYVVHSTFGGRDDLGNVCSNGGGVSSIGVSWTIINSLFTYNRAIGNGGNTMTLSVWGSRIEHNEVNAYGSAIFFVSNNHDGTLHIQETVSRDNINHSGHPWEILPGISGHDDTTLIVDDDSIIEP